MIFNYLFSVKIALKETYPKGAKVKAKVKVGSE